MQLAQTLRLDDQYEKSLFFNLTDELLTLSSGHPAYAEKFKQLNNLIVGKVLKQPELRTIMDTRGIYFVKGIGVTICSFDTLSVYHYIRMTQDALPDVREHFDQVNDLATNLYTQAQFRSGPLSAPEAEKRLFHFNPQNRLNYRVEHLMQVLPHNRHGYQQFFADMAIVTAAGGQND
jgi:hypothetical protein